MVRAAIDALVALTSLDPATSSMSASGTSIPGTFSFR